MFQPGPDALSQNFMKLGLLVAEKNVDRKTRFMFYKYRLYIKIQARETVDRNRKRNA